MRSPAFHSEPQQRRAGFSLVELLVVMTIMAILASLAFVTIGASGNAAREASTKTSIRILSGALRERVEAFHKLTASPSQIDPDLPTKTNSRVFRETVTDFNRRFANLNGLPLPYPQASEAFVRKVMFKSIFPQRVEDLYGYNGLSNAGGLDDSPMLARMFATPGTPGSLKPDSWLGKNGTGSATADSSELLYLALTEGDVFGMPASDVDGIDDNMIGDTDGDGNLEFLDGWGRPLQFYNWPTRLIKDDGVNYTGTVTFGTPTVTYPTTSLLISNLPTVGGASADASATLTVSRNRIDRDPDDPARWLLRTLYSEDFNFNGMLDAGEDQNQNGILDPPQGFPLYKAPAQPPTFDIAGIPGVQRFHTEFFHDPATASMPLVVSGGSDGVLGLHLPTESGADRLARVIQTEEACLGLSDNITNQQRGPQ